MTLPMPRSARVTVRQIDPRGPTVIAWLGNDLPRIAWSSGWEVRSRPRRIGYTNWVGGAPRTLSVPLLLDGFSAYTSVEGPLYTLERMARFPVGRRHEPPVVRISGPLPGTAAEWVIDSIEYGDEIRRLNGDRIRAEFILNLVEYVEGDVTLRRKKSPAHHHRQQHHQPGSTTTPSTKVYRVRSGDTLWSIAQHQLGDGNRWHEIARLNHLRDPNHLRIGQKLRLP
jgi:hypothetical protein